jgi:hypothetical protein
MNKRLSYEEVQEIERKTNISRAERLNKTFQESLKPTRFLCINGTMTEVSEEEYKKLSEPNPDYKSISPEDDLSFYRFED